MRPRGPWGRHSPLTLLAAALAKASVLMYAEDRPRGSVPRPVKLPKDSLIASEKLTKYLLVKRPVGDKSGQGE